jgi:bacteriorhodopsin
MDAYVTYYILFAASTISFFLGFIYKKYKTILWLESTITFISSCMYYYYMDKPGHMWRYVDWALTTPLLLISLSLILSEWTNILFPLWIIPLDLLLVFLGYAGEVGWMTKQQANMVRFIPFVMIFVCLYSRYKPKGTAAILFYSYLGLWFSYGVAYVTDPSLYNMLDAISKTLISLFLYGSILWNL